MKCIIIYQSRYGTTERYAKWLAENLGCQAVSAEKAMKENFDIYDTVILGGGLYAGGIGGASVLKRQWDTIKRKKIVVFTVGLADPAVTDYRRIIDKNFNAEQQKAIRFFHLRGGINYHELGPIHRIMMALMKNVLQKKEEAKLTDDERGLLDTYGKAVDFTNRDSLRPIVEYVDGLMKGEQRKHIACP